MNNVKLVQAYEYLFQRAYFYLNEYRTRAHARIHILFRFRDRVLTSFPAAWNPRRTKEQAAEKSIDDVCQQGRIYDRSKIFFFFPPPSSSLIESFRKRIDGDSATMFSLKWRKHPSLPIFKSQMQLTE